jgi:KaiC/GvpD/RAD55 family RecA-like ATPase
MTQGEQAIRFDREALAEELTLAGGAVRGSAVRCPFHDDRSASGSIHQGEDGVWRFTCHGGSCNVSGDVYDIRALRTGRTTAEVLKSQCDASPKPSRESCRSATPAKKVWPTLAELETSLPKIERRFEYTDNRQADLIVYRCIGNDGKKTFRQVHPVDGGYAMESPPKPWPIYNRQRVRAADVVIVVEGEKCVHSLHDVGIVATTSPCGAGKAGYADWSLLAGKTVYLWPDHDEAGLKHVRDVAKILENLDPAPDVYQIDPEGLNLPVKGDVVDYLANLGPVSCELKQQAVQDVLSDAQTLGPSGEVQALFQSILDGRYTAIDWPWPWMTRLTKALLPGTVTIICGDPGASKSFLLLQAAAHWQKQGIKVAVFELEEDRAYHLRRALAQESESSRLFDDDWLRSNVDEIEETFGHYQKWLDDFGRCIYEAPDKQMSLTDLAEWTKQRAKAGCRIIAIDPVTAAESDEKPWVADLKFMMAVKTTAREYGVSVILVTHPKKGRKSAIGMDELAGGAAYQRFAQTILWLEHHKTSKTVTVKSPVGGTMPIEVNRTIHLAKTRNGVGHGVGLAYQFNGSTLRFDEKGIIQIEQQPRL